MIHPGKGSLIGQCSAGMEGSLVVAGPKICGRPRRRYIARDAPHLEQ